MERSRVGKAAVFVVLLAGAGVVAWLALQNPRTAPISQVAETTSEDGRTPSRKALNDPEDSVQLPGEPADAPTQRDTEPGKAKSVESGNPTAAELRARFDEATQKLDAAKKQIEDLGGRLPEVEGVGQDPEELRRKLEENMRRYHEKATDPDYQKQKDEECRLSTLRKKCRVSEGDFRDFAEPADDIEYLDADALKQKFDQDYLGALSTYFEGVATEDESDAAHMFRLLRAIAA